MSDIPKSKRAYSNLEAHHKALEIRRKIAVELLASFAYSEKKLEEAVRKQTQHIQDPEHRAEAAQAKTTQTESGYTVTGEGDPAIDALVLARYEAKKAKNFAEADRIRDELKAQGIEIIDTKGGASWKRV